MDWSSWKPATCLPNDCWCEVARNGSWILEPVNTWTNLGFVGAGIWFFLNSNRLTDNSNKLASDSFFPRLYAMALLTVGLGSFFYHASQTFIGQWFDVFGMYLVSVFYISYNFYRSNIFSRKNFINFYVTVCLALGLLIIYFPQWRREFFGTTLAFTLLQTLIIHKRLRPSMKSIYLWGALGSYLLAQMFWILDKNKIWCDPYAWINGHGIWHLLTASSAILIYCYFQSEKNKKTEDSL
jgi:magnesium-transporting ATPase (P-type)